MRIMLAADGSRFTEAAARQIVADLDWFADRPEVHVVHVHPPVPLPVAEGVTVAAGRDAVDRYYREESEAALEVARKVLGEAGVPCKPVWMVGDVATELEAYARRHGIDLVVMGSHGHGALANVVLGSVATKCLAALSVPVLVIPRHARALTQGLAQAAD